MLQCKLMKKENLLNVASSQYRLNPQYFYTHVYVKTKCTKNRLEQAENSSITEEQEGSEKGTNSTLKSSREIKKVKSNSKSRKRKMDDHEVEFLEESVRFLSQQGYDPFDIAILFLHNKQLIEFNSKIASNTLFEPIEINTVQYYNENRNKVVLLSLRCEKNKENDANSKKLLCIFLSKPTERFFKITDMQSLSKISDVGKNLKVILDDENYASESFTYRCQRHRDQFVKIKSMDYFKDFSKGICSKTCDFSLPCGHSCLDICHAYDPEHKIYKCRKKCNKKCPNGHACLLQCCEDCQPCQINVTKKLKCGHMVDLPCSTDPDFYSCQMMLNAKMPDCSHTIKNICYLVKDVNRCEENCKFRLDCGHACTKKCHSNSDPDHLEYKCMKSCARTNSSCVYNHPCQKLCFEECGPCSIVVDKKFPCGHTKRNVKCSEDIQKYFCIESCNRILSCGHKCPLLCVQDCGMCAVMVEKKSSCGHKLKVKCSEKALPSKCDEPCPKILPCGHFCTNKCKDECTVKCEVMVFMKKPGLCGHKFQIPCHFQNIDPKSTTLLKYCQNPCKTTLACGHRCVGNCFRCYQGCYHVFCEEPCQVPLICGHKCEIPCDKKCRPCSKPCELQCRHSRCSKRCGEPCTRCIEKCEWGCKHRRCTKRCYEPCDIEPCPEPCDQLLRCNHPCVGFCGDPCPPLCRICDKDQLTEIFFGNEDNPNARFVLLPDCNHIIENEGLLQWIRGFSSNNGIQVLSCPMCKIPISTCMRIMNFVRKNLNDLMVIKKKMFFDGDERTLEITRMDYIEIIENVEKLPIIKEFEDLFKYLENLKEMASGVKNNKKYTFNMYEVDAIKIIMNVIFQIINHLKLIDKSWNQKKAHTFVSSQISVLIRLMPNKLQISDQEVGQIQLELKRLYLQVKLCNLCSGLFGKCWELFNSQDYETLYDCLYGVQPFTKSVENKVLKILRFSKNVTNYKEIVKAMGMKKGHWFKCPQGHFYVIDNCGGPMQRGKCIECKAVVGGEKHRLQADNAFAGEIDGATAPAWRGNIY